MAERVDSAMEKRIEADEKYRRELFSLFKNLRAQAVSNREHFKEGKATHHERFQSIFTLLYDHLDNGIEPGIDYFLRIVHLYDFDVFTPGNGYRSFIKIIHKCCLHTLQITRHITVNRDSFLFRSGHYCREIDAYVSVLGQLRACLYYLQKLVSYCEPGALFADQDALPPETYKIAEYLMMEVETLNQECFYGRVLGFQFCPSLVKTLTTISLAMASYADGYEQNYSVMKLASSLIGGSKYILDPESRAKQVINITRNGDVRFCKAFWSLAESTFMHQLPLYMCPSVQLDKVIVLPPKTFEIATVDGTRMVKVTPPCAHTGPGPVNTRLISYHLHRGQEHWKGKATPTTPNGTKQNGVPDVKEASPYLLFQCHGGGFVAQSSASHQTYLRSWSKDLGCPIFCVDYSLAPEHPFPRQLEEVFYAYCWARQNASLLGWTGEKIVMTGDSAGGNLVMALAMRIGAVGLRQADGIVNSYGTVLIRYTPSPARLMSLLDPLLPVGIVASVLSAYSGLTNNKFVSFPYNEEAQIGQTEATIPTGPPIINGVVNESDIEEIKERASSVSRHKSTASRDSGFHENQETASEPSCEMAAAAGVSAAVAAAAGNEVECQVNSDSSSGAVSFGLGEMEADDEEDSDTRNQTMEATKRSEISKDKLQLDLGDAGTSMQSHRDLLMSKSPSMPAISETHKLAQAFKHTPDNQSYGTEECPFWCPPTYAQVRHYAQSPVLQFRHLPIATNPYMSPFLAPEKMIRTLPKTCFIALHLDPMLDDSISLAKRMRDLGQEVKLDIIEDLPHGFLNFTLLSQEAKAGSDLCVLRIKELFEMDTINDDEFEILKRGGLEEKTEAEQTEVKDKVV